MNEKRTFPAVAVVGAGAVGCYFGGMLARAGAPTTLIGRPVHVEAINRAGLLLDAHERLERIAVVASTDVAAIGGADLVLLSVKCVDTVGAALALRPHLRRDSLLLSLQNGADNVERIRVATGIEAFPAVVYIAAEMAGPGHVRHKGRGELVIGNTDRPGRTGREPLAAMFLRAGIPCTVTENITGELWTKLLVNCAYNAISALSRATYGAIGAAASTREVMELAMREVLAVGTASGVKFPEKDLVAEAFGLSESMGKAISSTAQDIARGKATEIDSLNGYVARRGRALGIETPVNRTLHALVKLLEGAQEPAG